jgi:hypothetical protein
VWQNYAIYPLGANLQRGQCGGIKATIDLLALEQDAPKISQVIMKS